ncbi:MAG: cation:proton antiporter subunit C [Oscillospiraceae bacterium]|nr:cation:proton antiporter subunit C [Oscillospiraceae bacterium]
MNYEIVEIFAVVLFFVSLFGLITSKGVIKGIVSIIIMEISVVMFFLSLGFRSGILPPIGGDVGQNAADPLPQALMITAIIIGVAVTAVNMTMLIALSRQFKTTEWDLLKKMKMDE